MTNVLTLVSPIGICYCYHIPISNFNCVARHDSVCSKGIGDIPQQAKCVRVITKALLANLRQLGEGTCMWKLYKLLDAGAFLCGGEALNLFQTVKEHVNTRDFVEHIGLSINRSGMICCPFHDDRHPSMKVDERFFCFGCGEKGDVIDFVSRYYSVGLKQAAEYIVSEFGLQNYLQTSKSKEAKAQRKATVKRKLPFYKRRAECITHLNHYVTYLQNIIRDESPGNPDEEISEAYFLR